MTSLAESLPGFRSEETVDAGTRAAVILSLVNIKITIH